MTAQIAIVGAGPSGCFLAQALLKAAPDLGVDLIDALPVPYGLVRYGVAADHQGTKAVIRQFERLFERQGARFIGNLAVGRDVTLEDLRAAYDVVVLAAGLAGDRRLGIPGEDLPGVAGAGAVTRALYDHPDAGPLPPLGPRVVIMGNGNVAIDLLRLLAKTSGELDGSDLGATGTEWLAGGGVEEITIVGRSPAHAAKFDPVMIRELSKLGGVTIRVIGAGASDDPEGVKRIEALTAIDGHTTGARRVTFRFGLTPKAVEGEGHVAALRFQGGDGQLTLPCDLFLTAIGFADAGTLNRDALLANAQDAGAGVIAPGLYATGWFRRGPTGTIPDNRADAQTLAARILTDLPARTDPTRKGHAALAHIPDLVDYAGWKRIDAAEIASPPDSRVRAKIADRATLLDLALSKEPAR